MPVNKSQLGRLLVIHGKLSTGRSFTWEQLAHACEDAEMVASKPSERTIREDIRLLREAFGAPIPKWKSQYYYKKPFSLLTSVDQEDLALLNESVAILGQFRELPQADGLQEVLLKLETEAGLRSDSVKNIVFFEQVDQLRGLHYLNQLYNYIKIGRCLTIDYEDFSQNHFRFVVHPYFLKEYNNRWYLYGLEEEGSRVLNLALDRIRSVSDSDSVYRPNEEIVPEAWFRDMVGVTRSADNRVENVVLKVLKPRAYYVLTKPLHVSQELLTETDDYMEMGYRVIINKEFESKILELGADAVVMAPDSLKTALGSIIRKMGLGYC